MKILFLKHKSTLNYFKEFNDEINLYGQWLTRHNIPYQFDFQEWDEDLQWQQSGNNYTLSPTYMQKLSKKAWWSIGEYHIVIYCYYPEKENSEGYYRTMNFFKCNGGIGILVPLTKLEVENDILLASIASVDLRDAAVNIIKKAEHETRNRTAEIVQWVIMGGVIILALVVIIMSYQFVSRAQADAWARLIEAGKIVTGAAPPITAP